MRAMCGPTSAAGIALGHRRLSIVDLSAAGAQPMVSSCGRFVISYNGEAYNAGESPPRARTRGTASFRGHSDTEVIVEGAAVWGVEATVKRLIGMFAMALWDRQERTLYLVRDRLGIKPLYWTQMPAGVLLFGSELKALRAYPGFARGARPRRAGLLSALRLCAGTPHRSTAACNKLAPGAILAARAGKPPEIRAFWTLDDIARQGQAARFNGSEEEAAAELDALLADAVKRRMIADVPLGAFLSGGIDSSTVVALMQKSSARPVRSFTIGFREKGFDEAKHAAAVRQPSRHRPYRALCLARTCARRHPAPARDVRRTLRRSVADSHIPGLRDDAQARHRRAVGRRRRRTVRRL